MNRKSVAFCWTHQHSKYHQVPQQNHTLSDVLLQSLQVCKSQHKVYKIVFLLLFNYYLPVEKCAFSKDIFPGPGILKKNPGLSRRRGNPASCNFSVTISYVAVLNIHSVCPSCATTNDSLIVIVYQGVPVVFSSSPKRRPLRSSWHLLMSN